MASDQVDYLGDAGSPGPWVTRDGVVNREQILSVANLIASSQDGVEAHEVAENLNMARLRIPGAWAITTGSDRRVDRVLILLKRWGLIQYSRPRWRWIGGLPEERAGSQVGELDPGPLGQVIWTAKVVELEPGLFISGRHWGDGELWNSTAVTAEAKIFGGGITARRALTDFRTSTGEPWRAARLRTVTIQLDAADRG